MKSYFFILAVSAACDNTWDASKYGAIQTAYGAGAARPSNVLSMRQAFFLSAMLDAPGQNGIRANVSFDGLLGLIKT